MRVNLKVEDTELGLLVDILSTRPARSAEAHLANLTRYQRAVGLIIPSSGGFQIFISEDSACTP